jgi:hypothetical protein
MKELVLLLLLGCVLFCFTGLRQITDTTMKTVAVRETSEVILVEQEAPRITKVPFTTITTTPTTPPSTRDKKQRIHLLTYGNQIYAVQRDAFHAEAVASGWFDTVTTLNESVVLKEMPLYIQEFIKGHKRGGGYFIWKPWIIKKRLSQIPYDDILVYADSGCTLNLECGMSKPLRELKTLDILAYQTGMAEEHWTKQDTLERLNATDPKYRLSGQIMATYAFFRKTPRIEAFVAKWTMLALETHLIDDSPSVKPNVRTFQENRYDQSLFSLLVKTSGLPISHRSGCDTILDTRKGPRVHSN